MEFLKREEGRVDSFELSVIFRLEVTLMFKVGKSVSRMSRLVLKGLIYMTSANIED